MQFMSHGPAIDSFNRVLQRAAPNGGRLPARGVAHAVKRTDDDNFEGWANAGTNDYDK
jgi:hypothetical protein